MHLTWCLLGWLAQIIISSIGYKFAYVCRKVKSLSEQKTPNVIEVDPGVQI